MLHLREISDLQRARCDVLACLDGHKTPMIDRIVGAAHGHIQREMDRNNPRLTYDDLAVFDPFILQLREVKTYSDEEFQGACNGIMEVADPKKRPYQIEAAANRFLYTPMVHAQGLYGFMLMNYFSVLKTLEPDMAEAISNVSQTIITDTNNANVAQSFGTYHPLARLDSYLLKEYRDRFPQVLIGALARWDYDVQERILPSIQKLQAVQHQQLF